MYQQLVWPIKKKHLLHTNYQNMTVNHISSMLTPQTAPSPYRKNLALPSQSLPNQPLKWLRNKATPNSVYPPALPRLATHYQAALLHHSVLYHSHLLIEPLNRPLPQLALPCPALHCLTTHCQAVLFHHSVLYRSKLLIAPLNRPLHQLTLPCPALPCPAPALPRLATHCQAALLHHSVLYRS